MIEPTDEQVRAFLMARLTPDGVAPGFVFDEIDGCMDSRDSDYREQVGVRPVSGKSYMAHDESWEFQEAVVRAGLRAVLNMSKS